MAHPAILEMLMSAYETMTCRAIQDLMRLGELSLAEEPGQLDVVWISRKNNKNYESRISFKHSRSHLGHLLTALEHIIDQAEADGGIASQS
jgi:hypothetical protein